MNLKNAIIGITTGSLIFGTNIYSNEITKQDITNNNIYSYNNQNMFENILLNNNYSTLIIKNDEKNIRNKIINDAKEKFNTNLFGINLDNIEKKILENIEDCRNNKEYNCNIKYEIPSNFLVKDMDLRIEVDTKKIKSTIYQKINETELVLAEYPVAIGGPNRDYKLKKIRNFATPKGTYYIQRIVNNPFYYPPTWDKNTKRVNPGKNNPYGLWMAELLEENKIGDYSFPLKRDTGIRIHSTNRPKSMGTKSSHGCVRVHPDNANEIFPAFLRYTPHESKKKNPRGEIIPLLKTIRVDII